jgi:hypothetical protein
MRAILLPVLLVCSCSPARPEPTVTPEIATEPPSVSPETVPEYDRDEWGRWRDEDKDCQDTRQEVLVRQSEVPPTFKDEKGCKVATGKWTCPYTGETFTDPGKMDIDHVVPLLEAHESGGWRWDEERKRSYFNDLSPGHLVATSASSNRSKGARGPDEWMPEIPEVKCGYLRAWAGVKEKWGLEMDCGESKAMVSLVAGVCGLGGMVQP